MEPMEEAMGGPPKDLAHIVKGKRTKRMRPQSPIPFSIPTPSNSTGDDNDDDYNATSSEFVESATEEEEDMANCLILLAQGHSVDRNWNRSYHDHDREYVSKRYTSKKFVETNGKEGVYVYQCKTCNRSFPSFQALGGHRASHKKPKAMAEEKKLPQKELSFLSDDDVDEEDESKIKTRVASSNSLLQLMSSSNNNNNRAFGKPKSKSSPKMHECAICGAEFTSGQALGGHMRRHRAVVGASTALSLSPIHGFESESSAIKRSRSLVSLDLDLNLPAPDDDHRCDHQEQQQQKQQQQQQQQQKALVLSTGPALVDCLY